MIDVMIAESRQPADKAPGGFMPDEIRSSDIPAKSTDRAEESARRLEESEMRDLSIGGQEQATAHYARQMEQQKQYSPPTALSVGFLAQRNMQGSVTGFQILFDKKAMSASALSPSSEIGKQTIPARNIHFDGGESAANVASGDSEESRPGPVGSQRDGVHLNRPSEVAEVTDALHEVADSAGGGKVIQENVDLIPEADLPDKSERHKAALLDPENSQDREHEAKLRRIVEELKKDPDNLVLGGGKSPNFSGSHEIISRAVHRLQRDSVAPDWLPPKPTDSLMVGEKRSQAHMEEHSETADKSFAVTPARAELINYVQKHPELMQHVDEFPDRYAQEKVQENLRKIATRSDLSEEQISTIKKSLDQILAPSSNKFGLDQHDKAIIAEGVIDELASVNGKARQGWILPVRGDQRHSSMDCGPAVVENVIVNQAPDQYVKNMASLVTEGRVLHSATNEGLSNDRNDSSVFTDGRFLKPLAGIEGRSRANQIFQSALICEVVQKRNGVYGVRDDGKEFTDKDQTKPFIGISPNELDRELKILTGKTYENDFFQRQATPGTEDELNDAVKNGAWLQQVLTQEGKQQGYPLAVLSVDAGHWFEITRIEDDKVFYRDPSDQDGSESVTTFKDLYLEFNDRNDEQSKGMGIVAVHRSKADNATPFAANDATGAGRASPEDRSLEPAPSLSPRPVFHPIQPPEPPKPVPKATPEDSPPPALQPIFRPVLHPIAPVAPQESHPRPTMVPHAEHRPVLTPEPAPLLQQSHADVPTLEQAGNRLQPNEMQQSNETQHPVSRSTSVEQVIPQATPGRPLFNSKDFPGDPQESTKGDDSTSRTTHFSSSPGFPPRPAIQSSDTHHIVPPLDESQTAAQGSDRPAPSGSAQSSSDATRGTLSNSTRTSSSTDSPNANQLPVPVTPRAVIDGNSPLSKPMAPNPVSDTPSPGFHPQPAPFRPVSELPKPAPPAPPETFKAPRPEDLLLTRLRLDQEGKQELQKERTALEKIAKEKISDQTAREQFLTDMSGFQERYLHSNFKGSEGDKSKEVARAFHEINRMLTAPSSEIDNQVKQLPASAQAKYQQPWQVIVAEQFMRHACDPTTVDQGMRAVCPTQALQVREYHREPASVARMLTDVILTGQYTACVSGKHVNLKSYAENLLPDKESRNYTIARKLSSEQDQSRSLASQLYDVTATNLALSGKGWHYEQVGEPQIGQADAYVVNDTTGTRKTWRDALANNPPISVLTSDLQNLNEWITGNPEKGFIITPANFTVGNGVTDGEKQWDFIMRSQGMRYIHSQKGFANAIDQVEKDGMWPPIIHVDTRSAPFNKAEGGLHFVVGENLSPDKKKIGFDNFYGKDDDHLGNKAAATSDVSNACMTVNHSTPRGWLPPNVSGWTADKHAREGKIRAWVNELPEWSAKNLNDKMTTAQVKDAVKKSKFNDPELLKWLDDVPRDKQLKQWNTSINSWLDKYPEERPSK